MSFNFSSIVYENHKKATETNTVTNSQDQVDNNITADNPSVNVQVNIIAPSTIITNRRITVRVNKF